MNLLDLLLVVILGLSVAAGLAAGFARVGIGFFAALAGLLFGLWFYGIPAGWIHRYVASETISNIAGFFVVLAAFTMAGSLLAMVLSKLFRWTGLSWLDRALGGLFGLVRGAVIAIALVAVLLAFTPKPMPNWMVNSLLLPYAVDASNLAAAVAPNAVKRAFEESLVEIRKEWDEQLKRAQEKAKKLERDAKKEPGKEPKKVDF